MGTSLHQQFNANEALLGFLVGLLYGGTSSEVTEVVDKAHQLFLFIQIFCSEILHFIYIHPVSYQKVNLSQVLVEQISTSTLHSVSNNATCNVGLRVDRGN